MVGEGVYVIVHIEEMENGISEGWLMSPYVRELLKFHGSGDMILQMDHMLQWIWKEGGQKGDESLPVFHSFKEFSFPQRPKYFFVLQILHREHFSWQGVIRGTNCTPTGFKSVLDLLRKMDASMNCNTKKQQVGIYRG